MSSSPFTFKLPLLPLLLLLLLLLFPSPHTTVVADTAKAQLTFADQRIAMVYPVIQKFKTTITSDPLNVTQTWVGPNVCTYKGFYCDNPPDNRSATALASVDFNGFRLEAPTLSGFLDGLPDIALFHANSNGFAGTVSPAVSHLPYLYELDLSNNKLSGQFPAAVVGMTGLSFLDIRFNLFAGPVPPEIFTQNDLNFLFINNNEFTQNLPDDLGSSHFIYVALANNKFSGPIPRTISEALSTVTEILLLNNSLSGCLPYEIGLLKEATVLDAGNNRLTGPLPFSLGCLEKAEQLNFAGNLLYGAVPELLCALGSLVNLSLSDNYFTQVGPVCRVLALRGGLDIRKNCVPDLGLGEQRSAAECAAFFAFPRFCPHTEWYTYYPCKLPPFH
ncbi:uncharacterized protein At4g06744-like [Malania oleifera]|uniref:uncharacterized protein At4g06744-like n=1 Tax=Malania oleifera TaxID=397392 RepID=UPI0025AE82B4|nr:uncharacterized protein At4g06744-like [Malania oleifera]